MLKAHEVEDELELVIETTGDGLVPGVQAAPKDRRDTLVRDVDVFGRPARLR